MITDYLNQTASWQAKTANNSYGEPTYSTATTIKCRWEDKRKLIRNAQGVEIVSNATAYCVENVGENDLLAGRVVLMVADQPWLDGSISHREVYL